jgi:hypothetical protein
MVIPYDDICRVGKKMEEQCVIKLKKAQNQLMFMEGVEYSLEMMNCEKCV